MVQATRGPREESMAQDLIPSLAILKVNWDERRDYIDNFVPFVAECIRTVPQPQISVSQLQTAVGEKFGFAIPQGALQTILKRVERHGYIERAEGIYKRNDEALERLDFTKVAQQALREYEALIDKLVEFCAGRFEVKWSGDHAEAALFRYLEEDSSVILAATVRGRRLPSTGSPRRGVDYMVASFISEVERSDPEAFSFLETVVKGSMLAGVLLFPNLGAVERRFEGLDVFFDTPFVLQAMGLEGESIAEPRRELVRLLYDKNANLRIFGHTLGEVRNVLSAGAHALRNYSNLRHAYGPVIQHFLDMGYTASDVELVIARLEKSLEALHVRVVEKPPYLEALGVDEVKFQDILQSRVGYAREDTLYHDLDSLTAIHRLRKARTYLHIESCEAVFVTTNHDLAQASYDFYSREYEGYGGSIPHCMLDHVFTTMVWLKNPLSAGDFPRKKLIAECYAAIILRIRSGGSTWRRLSGSENETTSLGKITTCCACRFLPVRR